MFDFGELFSGEGGEAATNEALAHTGSAYRLSPEAPPPMNGDVMAGNIPKNPYSGGRLSTEDVNAMPLRQTFGHQNELPVQATPAQTSPAMAANSYEGGEAERVQPQSNSAWAQNAMNMAGMIPSTAHTDPNTGKKEGGGLQKIVGIVGPLLALL